MITAFKGSEKVTASVVDGAIVVNPDGFVSDYIKLLVPPFTWASDADGEYQSTDLEERLLVAMMAFGMELGYEVESSTDYVDEMLRKFKGEQR